MHLQKGIRYNGRNEIVKRKEKGRQLLSRDYPEEAEVIFCNQNKIMENHLGTAMNL